MQLVEDFEHPASIVDITDKMSVNTMEVDIHNTSDILPKLTDTVANVNDKIINETSDQPIKKIEDVDDISQNADDFDLNETVDNIIEHLDEINKEQSETLEIQGNLNINIKECNKKIDNEDLSNACDNKVQNTTCDLNESNSTVAKIFLNKDSSETQVNNKISEDICNDDQIGKRDLESQSDISVKTNTDLTENTTNTELDNVELIKKITEKSLTNNLKEESNCVKLKENITKTQTFNDINHDGKVESMSGVTVNDPKHLKVNGEEIENSSKNNDQNINELNNKNSKELYNNNEVENTDSQSQINNEIILNETDITKKSQSNKGDAAESYKSPPHLDNEEVTKDNLKNNQLKEQSKSKNNSQILDSNRDPKVESVSVEDTANCPESSYNLLQLNVNETDSTKNTQPNKVDAVESHKSPQHLDNEEVNVNETDSTKNTQPNKVDAVESHKSPQHLDNEEVTNVNLKNYQSNEISKSECNTQTLNCNHDGKAESVSVEDTANCPDFSNNSNITSTKPGAINDEPDCSINNPVSMNGYPEDNELRILTIEKTSYCSGENQIIDDNDTPFYETITSDLGEKSSEENHKICSVSSPSKVDNLNTEDNLSLYQKSKEEPISKLNDICVSEMVVDVDSEVSNVKGIAEDSSNSENYNKEINIDEKSIEQEIMDVDEIDSNSNEPIEKSIENNTLDKSTENSLQDVASKKTARSCLVNTLDIISDDEDEIMKEPEPVEKACINLDEDDDIMLIEDECNENVNKTLSNEESSAENKEIDDDIDENKKDSPEECITLDEEDAEPVIENVEKETQETIKPDEETKTLIEVAEQIEKQTKADELFTSLIEQKDDKIIKTVAEESDVSTKPNQEVESKPESNDVESSICVPEKESPKPEPSVPNTETKPIVPPQFITSFKSKISEMTRDELEEFCLLKIVEGITDRINMSEIKTKLKTMNQQVEEWRKKATSLLKQTRDLQIVLDKVQDEYKKSKSSNVSPMRITRSVGMQVFMSVTKSQKTKKVVPPNKNQQSQRPTIVSQKIAPKTNPPNNLVSPQPIPVPKLVPVSAQTPNKNVAKSPPQQSTPNTKNTPNGVKTSGNKADKRPFNSTQSITVDLTDDEPPPKQVALVRNQNLRLLSPQQLMGGNRQQFSPQATNSPRKVFIPISTPQNQNMRPGQTTIMFKPMQSIPRTRAPAPASLRMSAPNNIRNPRPTRHPAPLPDATKQPQPPNWKALPPSPDLKISKVDNGIVISWKIEGYQEDSYEEIASYQLYAYQETSSPPSTNLWKKIGDVKALPLPMACTLTQFMAGYKYFFAVRAVDVRSRIGPFSLPGSILLLNK